MGCICKVGGQLTPSLGSKLEYMKTNIKNSIFFLLGITVALSVCFLWNQNDIKDDEKYYNSRISVTNNKFIGHIPIALEVGEEAKCIDGITLFETVRVLGVSVGNNWLLVSSTLSGNTVGWIPSWTVEDVSQEKTLASVSDELSKAYIPENNNLYVESIKEFSQNNNTKPIFVCYRQAYDAPNHVAAMYITKQGKTFSVSVDTLQVIAFANGYDEVSNKKTSLDAVDEDKLQEIANNFFLQNSSNFKKYSEQMHLRLLGKYTDTFGYAYDYRGTLETKN